MPVIIQFFKELSPLKLAVASLVALTFLIIFFIYISKVSSRDMSILYSDLDLESSNKVIQELEAKKIPFQILSDGAVIKVPKEHVTKLRVNLAQAGLPNRGSLMGYEIFDKEDSIGTTNFTQNIKMVRALEGEISRTISAFEQIEKARVHLVLPQREIFSKERLEPRASIVIKFKAGKSLNKSEVDAISHLVVTAVSGLDMKNITIVDFKGKSLKLGALEAESEFGSSNAEEYRIASENRMKKIIEDLLEKSLGSGKVKAQVSLDMNFDRIVTNSEIYDPEGAVIRSVQSVDERERTPIGGEDNTDASVANNVPGGAQGSQGGGNFATSEKSDQTTNYEISKTVKNHISESGSITKMSIGILVDGTYATDPVKNESVYSPRTKEELDKIANLVKVAVGFSTERQDKIEVVNMQFSKEFDIVELEDSTDWIKEELPNLFQTLVFAIVVVLVLITVIRPIALKAFEVKKGGEMSPGGEMAFEGVGLVGGASSGSGGTLDQVMRDGQLVDLPGGEKSSNVEASTQKINDLVAGNPQETLAVLRKWLNENQV